MIKPFKFKPISSSKQKTPLSKVEFKGNIEEDSKIELNALQQGFKDRSDEEQKRFTLATDSEYWFCVCFSSREQKETFLKAMDLIAHGDKYLDGYEVAKKFNIELPKCNLVRKQRTINMN